MGNKNNKKLRQQFTRKRRKKQYHGMFGSAKRKVHDTTELARANTSTDDVQNMALKKANAKNDPGSQALSSDGIPTGDTNGENNTIPIKDPEYLKTIKNEIRKSKVDEINIIPGKRERKTVENTQEPVVKKRKGTTPSTKTKCCENGCDKCDRDKLPQREKSQGLRKPRFKCHYCSKQVTERMYRCIECPKKVILCPTCEAANRHPKHCVIRIPNGEIYDSIKFSIRYVVRALKKAAIKKSHQEADRDADSSLITEKSTNEVSITNTSQDSDMHSDQETNVNENASNAAAEPASTTDLPVPSFIPLINEEIHIVEMEEHPIIEAISVNYENNAKTPAENIFVRDCLFLRDQQASAQLEKAVPSKTVVVPKTEPQEIHLEPTQNNGNPKRNFDPLACNKDNATTLQLGVTVPNVSSQQQQLDPTSTNITEKRRVVDPFVYNPNVFADAGREPVRLSELDDNGSITSEIKIEAEERSDEET